MAEVWRTMHNDPGRYGEAFEEAQRQNPEAAAAYAGLRAEPAPCDTQELEIDSRGNIVGPRVLLSEVHRVTVETDDGPETFTVDYLDPVPFGPGKEE